MVLYFMGCETQWGINWYYFSDHGPKHCVMKQQTIGQDIGPHPRLPNPAAETTQSRSGTAQSRSETAQSRSGTAQSRTLQQNLRGYPDIPPRPGNEWKCGRLCFPMLNQKSAYTNQMELHLPRKIICNCYCCVHDIN
jgi:hypothetical protein